MYRAIQMHVRGLREDKLPIPKPTASAEYVAFVWTGCMSEKNYAHRDVTDKLDLKLGHSLRIVGKGDKALLARVREKTGRKMVSDGTLADVILYWPKTVEEITPTLTELRATIVQNGGIWVMTAKKGRKSASGIEHLNQTDLIPLGLAAGLVDNKTCSVSESESGMRFVIRKQERK